MKKEQRRTILVCLLALIICFGASFGTTYALFSASIDNESNSVSTGKLTVGLSRLNGDRFTDVGSGAVFDSSKWEPGYIDCQVLRITNTGTIGLDYDMRFSLADAATVKELLDSIDVYVKTSGTALSVPDGISGMTYKGTLSSVLTGGGVLASGELTEEQSTYVCVALCMQLNCEPALLPDITSLLLSVDAEQHTA